MNDNRESPCTSRMENAEPADRNRSRRDTPATGSVVPQPVPRLLPSEPSTWPVGVGRSTPPSVPEGRVENVRKRSNRFVEQTFGRNRIRTFVFRCRRGTPVDGQCFGSNKTNRTRFGKCHLITSCIPIAFFRANRISRFF